MPKRWDLLRRMAVILKRNNMKSGTPKKAPKVPIPPKDKPFAHEKQNDKADTRKNPQAPMTKKKLSK